jgi:2-keto-3-deoxy-6-phosphogluconate aldolase
LSGSVGGLNPTPTQFYAGNFTFTPSSNSSYVCSSAISYDMYTVDGMITPGQIAYYDRYGVSPITGFYYFTYGGGNEIYEINRVTGEIGYGSGYFC